MRILGIDPGLAIMGWGVVDVTRGDPAYVAHGVITTKPDTAFPKRLVAIRQDIETLLSTYQPDQIVFEELFFSRNVTTAFTVGAARGVAISTCAAYTDQLFEYTPMQIKQAVVGYGHADKQQVQQMLKMILRLAEIPRPDDAADAVAAAVTHAHAGRAGDQFRMK